jgi:endonuclease YncB( thermonuclease family)
MLRGCAKAALVLGVALLALARVDRVRAEQRVIDGDTMVIEGVHHRLYGIDAPESQQACADGWPAGKVASQALAALMEGRTITCELRGHDRYGRSVALCRADGRDLGADMVRAGMAIAYTRYSTDYAGLEAAARAARLGVHVHGCIPPWEWRAQRH